MATAATRLGRRSDQQQKTHLTPTCLLMEGDSALFDRNRDITSADESSSGFLLQTGRPVRASSVHFHHHHISSGRTVAIKMPEALKQFGKTFGIGLGADVLGGLYGLEHVRQHK
ncbi:MAG TPA: hypothetical protein VLL05_16965 [Terriglobales bacterium]|nr:hypothetical protein [Terriglobales bacterium]